MGRGAVALAGLIGLVGLLSGTACAVKTPPVAPGTVAWRQPSLMGAEPVELRRAYADAWAAIRQGDRARGSRVLNGLVRATPSFAPGWASLGELALAAFGGAIQGDHDSIARALRADLACEPGQADFVD